MKLKNLFLNPHNSLEYGEKKPKDRLVACKKCGKEIPVSKIRKNSFVCPYCGEYFIVRARRRILMLTDKRSFMELDRNATSKNVLSFPGYDDKLSTAMKKSRENEGVICGYGTIGGVECAIFSMDPIFMMGSMGAVVGEKITRLFEFATIKKLPVLGICVSGGARMQEGMISLMQMSKVSCAVKRHSNAGLLYMALLTNPTTGGVEASFAMQADITIAEPFARVGFAGPRVVEKTINRPLPPDFQSSQRVLECGFLDMIVERAKLKDVIEDILKLHLKG
jgi:acetyl-CoA carboxylase carboxyl transferase subunit beta